LAGGTERSDWQGIDGRNLGNSLLRSLPAPTDSSSMAPAPPTYCRVIAVCRVFAMVSFRDSRDIVIGLRRGCIRRRRFYGHGKNVVIRTVRRDNTGGRLSHSPSAKHWLRDLLTTGRDGRWLASPPCGLRSLVACNGGFIGCHRIARDLDVRSVGSGQFGTTPPSRGDRL